MKKMINKKLKSIIKDKKIPFSFEFVEALKSNESKGKKIMNVAKVLFVTDKNALVEINNNERLYHLETARFRIMVKK